MDDITRFLKFFAILAVIGALATTACTEPADQSVGTDQQALTGYTPLQTLYCQAYPAACKTDGPPAIDPSIDEEFKEDIESNNGGIIPPAIDTNDGNGNLIERRYCVQTGGDFQDFECHLVPCTAGDKCTKCEGEKCYLIWWGMTVVISDSTTCTSGTVAENPYGEYYCRTR